MTPADTSRHAKAALRDAARSLAAYKQALASADPETATRIKEAIKVSEEHARYWQDQIGPQRRVEPRKGRASTHSRSVHGRAWR